MTFMVVQANVHGSMRAVRRALTPNPDLLSLCESPVIKRIRGRRVHQAQPVRKMQTEKNFMRLVSTETCTLTRARFEHLGAWHQQVSQQVPGVSRVAPDRWFTVAAFEARGLRMAHVNIHPNAGLLETVTNPKTGIGREYRESMTWLRRMIELYQAQDYAVLVTGDFNLPNRGRGNVAYSPFTILGELGFRWYAHRIDAIAWEAEHFTQVGDGLHWDIGSDHPGLRVVLETKGSKR